MACIMSTSFHSIIHRVLIVEQQSLKKPWRLKQSMESHFTLNVTRSPEDGHSFRCRDINID